jgi:acetoin utilization protein AcuC
MKANLMKSVFIYSDEFGKFKVSKDYPWLTERSDVTYKRCSELNLLDRDWMKVVKPRTAAVKDLYTYHTKEYIQLLRKADKGVFEESMLIHGLGTLECPAAKGLFKYHTLAAGATICGADLICRKKADIVFSPTGGFHHAGPDFASGFCYINDINIAVKKLLNHRKRVLYVDIDTHHGGMVQEAFYGNPGVMYISFHESGKTLFPWKTGFETEIGKGKGKGYNINFPLPENTGDDEFLWGFERVLPPVAKAFKPDVVVAVIGVDMMFSDPMSHLRLTNNAFVKAVGMIKECAPELLALGCGGYVLNNIERSWTLAWAAMNGLLPVEDESMTFGGMFWGDGLSSLMDRSYFSPDDIRKKTAKEVRRVYRYIKKQIFPILEIRI